MNKIELTKKIAIGAGKIILEKLDETHQINHKGKYDLVTEVDIKSEEYIISKIQQKFPDHDIVTEEKDIQITNSDYVWYIDPISGTTNYSHGFPIFSISIGLAYRGEMIIGVVYDPLRNELFYADKGNGAYLNEKKIKVSKTDLLKDSLISTGFPYKEKLRMINLELFNNIVPKIQGIRRPGSVVLDICYVACGRLDGFWAIHLKPWDVAAAWLIVNEAGGKVTTLDLDEYSLDKEEILVSNGRIHEEFTRILLGKKVPDPGFEPG